MSTRADINTDPCRLRLSDNYSGIVWRLASFGAILARNDIPDCEKIGCIWSLMAAADLLTLNELRILFMSPVHELSIAPYAEILTQYCSLLPSELSLREHKSLTLLILSASTLNSKSLLTYLTVTSNLDPKKREALYFVVQCLSQNESAFKARDLVSRVLSRLGETSISKIEEYRTAIQSFVTI